tara:strand:+ start:1184 stop:1408 length:225 start_codon:yes stop_codon:yes gene_type:complete
MKDKNNYVKDSTYSNVRIETTLSRTKIVNGKPEPEPLFVDVDNIIVKIEENDKDKAIDIIKQKIKNAKDSVIKN